MLRRMMRSRFWKYLLKSSWFVFIIYLLDVIMTFPSSTIGAIMFKRIKIHPRLREVLRVFSTLHVCTEF